MSSLIRLLFLAGAALYLTLIQAAEPVGVPVVRSGPNLLIYNDDLALVNMHYSVSLPEGESVLRFPSISPLIQPSSAILHPLPDTLSVLQQSYRGGMTPETVLANSVGQEVSLISTNPVNGEELLQRARILSVAGGLIFEVDGRFETSLAGRRVVYDRLPLGVLNPGLTIRVRNTSAGQTDLNLSYLTGGISWRADYVAQLNGSGDALQLQSMASLSNHSGLDFQEAKIALVAGSINRVRDVSLKMRRDVAMAAMDSGPVAAPVSLAEMYLYKLPDVVRLADGSTQQFDLFSARDIPVERRYELHGQATMYFSSDAPEQTLKVDGYIEFINDSEHNLGMPMPAGIVRVYAQPDDQVSAVDTLYFIGEDRIGHTPAEALIHVNTGKAFDLSGTRKQLAFRRLPVEAPYRHHSESTIQIDLKNVGKDSVTVNVRENFSGEWRLTEGPKPDEQDARTATWALDVPAQGAATLKLTVRVKR